MDQSHYERPRLFLSFLFSTLPMFTFWFHTHWLMIDISFYIEWSHDQVCSRVILGSNSGLSTYWFLILDILFNLSKPHLPISKLKITKSTPIGLITDALNPPGVKPKDHMWTQGVKSSLPFFLTLSDVGPKVECICLHMLCTDFRFITSLSLPSWLPLHLGCGIFQKVPSLLQTGLWWPCPMSFPDMLWLVLNTRLAQGCTFCSKNLLSIWERLPGTYINIHKEVRFCTKIHF